MDADYKKYRGMFSARLLGSTFCQHSVHQSIRLLYACMDMGSVYAGWVTAVFNSLLGAQVPRTTPYGLFSSFFSCPSVLTPTKLMLGDRWD